MERVSGDLRRAPGFPKGPAGPLAVPRASEVAAGFSVPFCPVKKERSREPEADPCGPQRIQNKEPNPGDVKATRNMDTLLPRLGKGRFRRLAALHIHDLAVRAGEGRRVAGGDDGLVLAHAPWRNILRKSA